MASSSSIFLEIEQAERHGRVDVTTRDGADGVRHGQQRDPEGEGDAVGADHLSRENRGAYSAEDEDERADEFGCSAPLRHDGPLTN